MVGSVVVPVMVAPQLSTVVGTATVTLQLDVIAGNAGTTGGLLFSRTTN